MEENCCNLSTQLIFQENSTHLAPVSNLFSSNPWLSLPFIILYCGIFIIGLSGNTLVVYVVARNKTMHSITNTFITNLAISDIMMCLLAVPFTPTAILLHNWVFGEILCNIVPMTLCVSVYVSTLTSTAIAVDRYFVVVHPFKPRMSLSICLALIVAIWLTSLSISFPLSIYNTVSFDPADSALKCHEEWPRFTSRQFFTATSFVLQYIIPCSVITYCYTHVSRVLSMRAKFKITSGTRGREREDVDLKRKRRTNKMLIAMVSIFVCCWLPLNVFHMVTDYNSGTVIRFSSYNVVFLCVHVVAMSSTIYNPFLYAWLNENFKKEFKLVLPILFPAACNSANEDERCPASQYTTVEQSVACRLRTQDHQLGSSPGVKDKSLFSQAGSVSDLSEAQEIPMSVVQSSGRNEMIA